MVLGPFAVVFCHSIGAFFLSGSCFGTDGKALLVGDEIKGSANLIVVLRGGSNFERLLEAFELLTSDK